ncbi:hypothetical protein F4804DRAFT_315009 [Jackrogersella minutella]|nr:hypothetical protein F4804DRAFT_315009 [Jackrogersella minutella]
MTRWGSRCARSKARVSSQMTGTLLLCVFSHMYVCAMQTCMRLLRYVRKAGCTGALLCTSNALKHKHVKVLLCIISDLFLDSFSYLCC